RRMMEEHDFPELTCGLQIPLQPVKQIALAAHRRAERICRIQRDKVRISPIKRIVVTLFVDRNGLRWQTVQREICPRVRVQVLVISGRREERDARHYVAVITKIVRQKLLEVSVTVSNIADVKQK